MAEKLKLPNYGGQALIEGVLMRGSRYIAAAFRKPDGTISMKTEKLPKAYQNWIIKTPVLRGLLMLWDSLGIGIRYLTVSSDFQTGDNEEKIEGASLVFTISLSFIIAIGVFFLLPALIGSGLEKWLHVSHWISNLAEGLIRLALLLIYLVLIRRMPEIYRVFQYHGAEHKTINAFEANMELTPENLLNVSSLHPRCGTAFLLTLVVLSIIVFTLLGPMNAIFRLISRLLLLPILSGFAYELLRWTANNRMNPLVSIIIKPNLWLQKLTTAEPDKEMLEIAITAFNTMLKLENSTD